MTRLSAHELSGFSDLSLRGAQAALQRGYWNGIKLPVERISGQRGGKGGAAWGLRLDLCPPEVLAKLGLDERAETALSMPSEQSLKGRAGDRQVSVALDRQRIISPILAMKRRSTERAQAFRDVAAQPAHQIGGRWQPVAERTLRDWVNAAETNTAELLPSARNDRGQRRVRITRAWDANCGLTEDVQARIAGKLAGVARGLLANGRSERNVRTLCTVELQKLTAEAGAALPKAQLAQLCKLNSKWSAQFSEMKAVHAFASDNKTYTDR
ncbi:hypothetical protein [Paracoccus aminovorans]|uniref:hypothetical protein n=1 Tax=Paracoccus aminovorans TaxID=34004 RepID=UPI000A87EE10|nr:hypothetical protein [Paracoccus aminovorans]